MKRLFGQVPRLTPYFLFVCGLGQSWNENHQYVTTVYVYGHVYIYIGVCMCSLHIYGYTCIYMKKETWKDMLETNEIGYVQE